MIWSQKSKTVVCLHTPNEILDPFWPQEINKEVSFGEFDVTLLRQFDLSNSTELNVKVMMHGSDAILNLSIIQIKTWNKSLVIFYFFFLRFRTNFDNFQFNFKHSCNRSEYNNSLSATITRDQTEFNSYNELFNWF